MNIYQKGFDLAWDFGFALVDMLSGRLYNLLIYEHMFIC